MKNDYGRAALLSVELMSETCWKKEGDANLVGDRNREPPVHAGGDEGIRLGRRIPASQQTSERIQQMVEAFEAYREGPSLTQLGLRKIVEELLEAEVAERLGRGYYERGGGAGAGHRNGYRRGRLKTAEGEVEYSIPQVRGLEEPFRSRLRPELGKRTEALEDLAVEMYARGLSTRDSMARASRRAPPQTENAEPGSAPAPPPRDGPFRDRPVPDRGVSPGRGGSRPRSRQG